MGLVVSRIGEEAKALANLFHALDVVITRMVMLIMWLGPIGIPSLIAQKMLEVSDLWLTARMLGLFVFTVILGLAIQVCMGFFFIFHVTYVVASVIPMDPFFLPGIHHSPAHLFYRYSPQSIHIFERIRSSYHDCIGNIFKCRFTSCYIQMFKQTWN